MNWGRLSFGYFSLAKQRKVTRQEAKEIYTNGKCWAWLPNGLNSYFFIVIFRIVNFNKIESLRSNA